MTRSILSRTLAGAAAFGLVASVGLLGAPSAVAEDSDYVQATPQNTGPGYDNVYEGEDAAAVEIFQIDGGDSVWTFCIEHGVAVDRDNDHTVQAESNDTLDAVSYMLQSADEVGDVKDDEHGEMAARQLAVWVITDNIEITEDTVANYEIAMRALDLADFAEDHIGEAPSLSERFAPHNGTVAYDFDVEANRLDEETVELRGSLATADGEPIVGETVTFDHGNGEVDTATNESGNASVELHTTDAGEFTAEWTGELPAGAVLQPEDGQRLMTVDTASLQRDGTASFEAAEEEEGTEDDGSEDDGSEDESSEDEGTEDDGSQEDDSTESDNTGTTDETGTNDQGGDPVTDELPDTGPGLGAGILAGAAALLGVGTRLITRNR